MWTSLTETREKLWGSILRYYQKSDEAHNCVYLAKLLIYHEYILPKSKV